MDVPNRLPNGQPTLKPGTRTRLVYTLLLLPFLLAACAAACTYARFCGARRAWVAWRAEREALGDPLQWQDLLPPKVPDGDNFAKAPVVLRTPCPFTASGAPGEAAGNWVKGRRTDRVACAKAYHAPDLLAGLAPMAAALRELEEASLRPGCGLPYRADGGQLALDLSRFTSALRALSQRGVARLAMGDPEGALRDVLTSLRVADHLKDEPMFLVPLARRAMVEIALQPVWEGLLDRRWGEAQLEALQARLLWVDLPASFRLGLQGDRAWSMAQLARHAQDLPPLNPELDLRLYGRDPRLLPPWMKREILYRDLLAIDRLIVTTYLDSIHPETHRVFPERWTEALGKGPAWALESHGSRLRLLQSTVRTQALCDLAAIACALERHRLREGAYPATLGELSPTVMARAPRDPVSGHPYDYRRQGARFLLQSPGWPGVPDEDPAAGPWRWFTEVSGRR
jgi:hypothetical protein